MNRALWRKAFSDSWRQLVVSVAILVLFSWVFVWFMSLLPRHAFAQILAWLPDLFGAVLGVPAGLLASPTGQLSLLYVHIITILVCVGWAVGRGSDSISGEIGRGTMDLILSLPLRRVAIIVPPAVVAALGAAVLPLALLLGTSLGLWTVDFDDQVSPGQFLPGAVNLGCMIVCLTGVTTFVSSWSRSRWTAISLSVGLYVVSVILEMISRVWKAGAWLRYLSISSAFQPHQLILQPEQTGILAPAYNLTLLGLGLAGYVAAAIVLSCRDIPSPR